MCVWQAAGGAGGASVGSEAAAVAPQGEPASLAGVYTLPSSGAATAHAAYGNVFIAGKISGKAISAKSYTGDYFLCRQLYVVAWMKMSEVQSC